MKKHLWAALVTLFVAGVGYYIMLPAINLHNSELLFDIGILTVVYCAVLLIQQAKEGVRQVTEISLNSFSKLGLTGKVCLAIIGALVLVGLIGSLSGAVLFRAGAYRNLLAVSEGDFASDVKEISYDQIPTLDYDSATKLGNRKLGELSDMVSQFAVLDDYTQINYKGTPTRVTPLGYADLFKWINNMKNGIPAYISIDMVSQDVTVHRLSEGMKYTESDHFNRNLLRHLRFNYPTYIFEEPSFEIDEEGTPYWICSRVTYRIGLYGGKDICGVVLVNAVTGEHQYYDLADVPSWVDRVYNADLIINQYDYYGTLQKGYWNSVFGQKDCKQTTDGYNYIAINDDVYMYTGVTSMAEDASNIGFILTNQRTKETKFYPISGAEEYSAMSSAEGEVQNLRYQATFPLLLNISEQPTYFVALKDEAGLVKMYAMVNVRQYQIVGKGQTLKACEQDYTAQLAGNAIELPTETADAELTAAIVDIRTAVVEGNTHYYLRLEGSEQTFVCNVKDDEEIVTYNVGDTVKIGYTETKNALVPVKSVKKETK